MLQHFRSFFVIVDNTAVAQDNGFILCVEQFHFHRTLVGTEGQRLCASVEDLHEERRKSFRCGIRCRYGQNTFHAVFLFPEKRTQQTAEGKNEEHHLFVCVKVLFADSLYTERAVFCTGKNFFGEIGGAVFQQFHVKAFSVAVKSNRGAVFTLFNERKAGIFRKILRAFWGKTANAVRNIIVCHRLAFAHPLKRFKQRQQILACQFVTRNDRRMDVVVCTGI